VETELRTPRPEKVAVVDDVRARLSSASATIVTEYRGLSVAQLQVLRRSLAAAGGEYRVYKNTLARRAAHESGLGAFEELLDGPTALAFVTGDVSSVAKALKEFARTNPKLVVKGALVGSGMFDAAQTSALADLPSRDILLAQIAGALAAPMQAFAGLLTALPRKFAYGLAALIEQRGGVGVAHEPVAEEAPAGPRAEVAPGLEPEEAAAPVAPDAVAEPDTTEAATDTAEAATDTAGVAPDTAGAAPDTAGVAPDTDEAAPTAAVVAESEPAGEPAGTEESGATGD
jgi:large subunit ribosomal protein L10